MKTLKEKLLEMDREFNSFFGKEELLNLVCTDEGFINWLKDEEILKKFFNGDPEMYQIVMDILNYYDALYESDCDI